MIKFIPITAKAGIVGFESPSANYVELGLSLDDLLIDKPAATFFALVDGTSMTGAGIHNGDILIVSRAEPITHLAIIVGTLNGEFVCKRLDRQNACLLSENPNSKPYFITDDDEFGVEGVVISSIRLHRKLTTKLGV